MLARVGQSGQFCQSGQLGKFGVNPANPTMWTCEQWRKWQQPCQKSTLQRKLGICMTEQNLHACNKGPFGGQKINPESRQIIYGVRNFYLGQSVLHQTGSPCKRLVTWGSTWKLRWQHSYSTHTHSRVSFILKVASWWYSSTVPDFFRQIFTPV